jgi:hypothetical protein
MGLRHSLHVLGRSRPFIPPWVLSCSQLRCLRGRFSRFGSLRFVPEGSLRFVPEGSLRFVPEGSLRLLRAKREWLTRQVPSHVCSHELDG